MACCAHPYNLPMAIYLQSWSPQGSELGRGSDLPSLEDLAITYQAPGKGSQSVGPGMIACGGSHERPSPQTPRMLWTQAAGGMGIKLALQEGPATVDISTSGLFMNSSISWDKPFCIRLPW